MNVMTVNPEIPKVAGKARLHFGAPDSGASRKDADIFLPLRPDGEYYPLLNGQQFLFRTPSREFRQMALYFGGTDEEPFLVQLNPRAFELFREGGETGFFNALVPQQVRLFEKAFNTKAIRQGDIFAVPASLTWKTLKTLASIERQSSPSDVKLIETKRESVFGTRHCLSGVGIALNIAGLGDRQTFVEGVIEAPDHANLELRHPHLLGQTAHLLDPTKAD